MPLFPVGFQAGGVGDLIGGGKKIGRAIVCPNEKCSAEVGLAKPLFARAVTCHACHGTIFEVTRQEGFDGTCVCPEETAGSRVEAARILQVCEIEKPGAGRNRPKSAYAPRRYGRVSHAVEVGRPLSAHCFCSGIFQAQLSNHL